MQKKIDGQAEYVVYNGKVLPPPELRFGGSLYRRDEDFVASGAKEAARMVTKVGSLDGVRVLDIGCGPGRLALGLVNLSRPGFSYVGLDVDERSIDWCSRYIQKTHKNFEFQRLDVFNARYNREGEPRNGFWRMPVEDSSIDVTYLYSVFSHLMSDDSRIYLNEIGRCLKPGGMLFLTAFLEDDVPNCEENPDGYRMVWKGPLHCVRYDRRFFLELASEAGLGNAELSYAAESNGQSAVWLQKPLQPK